MRTGVVPPELDGDLLKSFLEIVLDPCVIVDSLGSVLAVNRAWRDLPRRKEAAAAENHPEGLNYPVLYQSSMTDEGLDGAVAGINAVLRGDRDRFEHEYIRPNPHNFRWFRMTVCTWQHAGASAVIFHRDITAEKLDRLSSHAVEEEFHALADVAPALIWISGTNKGRIFCNRKWSEFTGTPPEEQLGEKWLQFVHPDDRERIQKAYDMAFQQRCPFEYEYRVRHVDGGYRWIRDHGSPRLSTESQIAGFIGTVLDLSDQKQANEVAERATRYARLIHELTNAVNSSITRKEALQGAVDLVCETMGFPVGHALLVNDVDSESAKSAHVFHIADQQRFAALLRMSGRMVWPIDFGAPGEASQSGRPSFHDILSDAKDLERYPRAQVAIDAGLRTSIHLPVLVDHRIEVIVEFGSEDLIEPDSEIVDALKVVSESLSRFLERRRAQITFLKQKKELQISAERLFAMAGRLVDSQEDERRRIAREIHDDFSQRLALVSMKIGNLAKRDRTLTSEELHADLEALRTETTSVANDLRDLSHQLHPAMLGLVGFTRALRAQCDEFQRVRGIDTTFEVSVSDEEASPQVATCLYRVLQESLMNIAKHSGSAKAWVTLTRQDDQLEMKIRDEGKGFISESEGYGGIGLLNMEERVLFQHGRMIINSSPKRGTEVVVRVPAAT